MGKVRPNVSPSDPVENQPAIGLIGMGMMGSMYARHFSRTGWKKSVSSHIKSDIPRANRPFVIRIFVCDIPSNYDALKETYKGRLHILPYPALDFLSYSTFVR